MAFSFNGFGTKFYGRREREPDGSYISTLWVVLLHLPVLPLMSVRMLPIEGSAAIGIYSSRRFRQQRVPLNWKQVLSVYAVVLGLPAAIALYVVFTIR